MYQYSTIQEFFKHWAEYKETEINKDDITILSFYAQEQYKRYNNNNKLFETYTETDIDFNWNDIKEKDASFLVKVWNTYAPIIQNGLINLCVANERNYKLIENKIEGEKYPRNM